MRNVILIINGYSNSILRKLGTIYSWLQTEMRDGHGLRCMLFDNAAILGDRLDSVYNYQLDVSSEEFDLHVDTILTGFYKYGEPVPVEREYLGSFLICEFLTKNITHQRRGPFAENVRGDDL